MNVLVDTNIIIDALQARKPWNKDAEEIFRLAAGEKFNAFITAKSITDIYYLCHHFLHDDRSTRQLITKLFLIFRISDTTAMDVQKALASNTPDYEDAVMIETAIREGCDCIVTRNLHDYSRSTISVYSPNEFLRIIHSSI